MASVQATLDQINSVLKNNHSTGEPGGKKVPYSFYSCKAVSWDDVQRGTVGDELSCWGSNITDTRLYAKDGRQLFTVRYDNWNERLGKVTANDLALIASDIDGGGTGRGLKPVTLRTVLSNISKYGGYANVNVDSLWDEKLDEEISVRFQTTFLPVEAVGEKQTLEFAPEAYNYNTLSDENPKNLILLCTTQGLAVQQDGFGAKKLYHHDKIQEDKDDEDKGSKTNCGDIHRYWLEAESSSHKVGGAQVETSEEKQDALERGKATSAVIGTKAIGTRFNVLMTIQVPLKQKKISSFIGYDGTLKIPRPSSLLQSLYGMVWQQMYMVQMPAEVDWDLPVMRDTSTSATSVLGHSSAARVSKGSMVDTWQGVCVKDPERHPNEHITATIVLYYTCSGGVPSAKDVMSAIDDIEELYKSVEVNGKLGDEDFHFMKKELTGKDMIDVKTKVESQPHSANPNPSLPMNADVFPH